MNEKGIEAARSLHFAAENIARAYKGYLPDRQTPDVLTRLALIEDEMKRADAALSVLLALPPLRAREEIARIIVQKFLGVTEYPTPEWQKSCLDVADAILSSTAGQEWRDISSAPKDGTRIWLGDAEKVVTGYWSPPNGAWRCDWLVGKAGDKPTHWMPLPAPPVAEPLLAEQREVK